jgi:GT2 family glycosyltransferase
MGWDNYLVPGAQAYHMGSASTSKDSTYSLYMTFRNNSGVLIKNFPLKILLLTLPKLIRGDIDTLKELRRIGKKKASHKMLKGRLVGILRIPLFLSKRFKLLSGRQVDKNYLWKLMNRGY